MEIERETLIQIVVSAGSVGLFVAAIILVGVIFSEDGLTNQGALALVAVIALFVVLMAGIGYWLSGLEV